MPTLVYPFLIVGAAAGWLAAELLDNPAVGFTASHAGGLAALCAGLIGAGVGRFLQRRCAPQPEFVPTAGMWWLVAVVVIAGGAASGLITGALAFGNEKGATSGLLAGVAAGGAFLPVCAIVVTAARRAARARLGSLIAGADRRELWAVLAAALSVMTMAAFPDWLAQRPPIVAAAMATAALGLTAALLARDLRTRRALRDAARAAEGMEIREGRADEAEGAIPALDLGLGDEVRAQVTRSAAAYRGRDRASALLVGSLDEAEAALRKALATKAVAALVVVAMLGAHACAARPRGSVFYQAQRCERGSEVACGIVAAMLREGAPEDLPAAVQYGARAHRVPGVITVRAAANTAEEIERGPAEPAVRLAYREQACLLGHLPSCRVAAQLAGGDDDGWRAAALLQRGCELGDMRGCEHAVEARRRAAERRTP